MNRKTRTISEKAYMALDRLASKDEPSTNVMPEPSEKKGNLLEYVRSFAPDNELANRLEKALEERSRTKLRGWPESDKGQPARDDSP